MKTSKLLAGMLVATLTLTPLADNALIRKPLIACAEEITESEQGMVFEENDGHMGVIGWTETIPEELVIPAEHDGMPVESIWPEAFKDCKTLKSVTLPDTVNSIGTAGFAGCENLESINLTNNIKTIGQEAFQDCSRLKAIHIPDSLEYMGTNAFKNCSELIDVVVSDIIKPVGMYSFYGTPWLRDLEQGMIFEENDRHMNIVGWTDGIPEELVIPADYFGVPVEIISPEAFKDCKTLKSVTLPDTVSGLGYDAFAGCENLESINLPENLEVIGECVFQDCPRLKTIFIPASVRYIEEGAFGYIYDQKVLNGKLVEGFTITSYKGTAAEAYALENNIPFIALNAESDILLGDVDNDGKVKISDVVLLQRYNNEEPVQISPEGRANADVNHDGILSADDVTDILKAIALIKVLQ